MRISALLLALVANVSAFSAKDMQAKAAAPASLLPPSQDPWYTAPENYQAARPGQILRLRAAPGNLTGVIANSSAAYNILYRTTDSRYNASWAVTTLLVPTTPNNQTLVSYQIPYDSADVDASPSYVLAQGGQNDVVALLKQGFFVCSPDYEGPLGSFTAGVQSGHATLDSIRAVRASGFGLAPSAKYAMWGYSGGALASEWAAELQVQYAPELSFAGAALGGLTPNVTSVLLSVNGGLEAGLVPAGILGLASQFPDLMAYLTDNLFPSGMYNATTFLRARNETLVGTIGAFFNQDITKYFKNGLASILSPQAQYVINRDGVMGYHGIPQMPIFAYKAIKDEVSNITDTDTLVARYCAVGANILYQRNTVGSHVTEGTNGDARAMLFLTTVLLGNYSHTGCTVQNVTVGGT